MKFKILLLLVIVFNSCSKKTEFISVFNCEVETFSNLERIEDVKNLKFNNPIAKMLNI